MKKFGCLAILVGLVAFGFSVPGRTFYKYVGDFQPPEVELKAEKNLFGQKITVPFTYTDWHPVVVQYHFDDKKDLAKQLDAPKSPLVIEATGLEDGEHVLHLSFTDQSAWKNVQNFEVKMQLEQKAPTVKLLSPQRIWEARQGDTLFVFIRSDKPIRRAELEIVRGPENKPVRVPGAFFEAAPQVWCLLRPIDIETPPGDYNDRFYLYDVADNEVTLTQRTNVRHKQPPEGDVKLTEGILAKLKVKTLEEQEEMRKQNNARVQEITSKFTEERYFQGPFIRPAQGTWTSPYGQRRLYNGKVWHRHLGMDLADVAGAEVFAANDAVVALAEPLGIYGNCVVLDHGRGVFTLYGHNNELRVKAGERVKKQQVIAIQGDTGLAGGIHLHLSFIVGGIYVAPDIFIQKFDVFEKELAAAISSAEPVPPVGQDPAAAQPATEAGAAAQPTAAAGQPAPPR